MEAENILKLLDSNWFELDFFKKQPTSSPSEPNPDHKSQENPTKSSEFSSLSSIASTSISEEGQLDSSKTSEILESLSPKSVLFAPKLQTIHSGKESKKLEAQETPTAKISSGRRRRRRRRRMDRKKGLSRSLSELEFQELKGFMDLGFVFSEEDKDSTLASVIPGLQRLGKKEEDEDGDEEREDDDDGSEISRPYLSEAWENLEKGKREKLLMNWRVPASTTSEIDMKEFLRCWAHYVASSVAR